MTNLRDYPLRQYKYLTFLSMAFIAIFAVCDTTAFRMVDFFGRELPLSGFIIPIIFAIGDITAEVYGYKVTVKMLKSGILCQCIFSVLIFSVLRVAPSPVGNVVNHSYDITFQHILRTGLTSCFSVTGGMLVNAFLISRLKIYMHGKRFWVRTILSCAFSEFVLCTVAYLMLFTGLKSLSEVMAIIFWIWVYKIVVSVLITPLTSSIVKVLKYSENSDVYDIGINYNPFSRVSNEVPEFKEKRSIFNRFSPKTQRSSNDSEVLNNNI